MDCVIAGGGVVPTSVPAWTEGAAESAPSVTQVFADTLEKLTGDLGVPAARLPDRARTSDAAKGSQESTDGSVTEDSAGEDKPAGYTEVCQVSWQPICGVPEVVPSAVEAPATPSTVVEDLALNMAEGRMLEDRHAASPDAQARATPRMRDLSGASATTGQTTAVPDPATFALPDDVVADSSPLIEKQIVGESAESPAPPPDPSTLKATTEKTSPPAAPSAAARSLARALEAFNVTTAPDAAKSSAAPVATDSSVNADIAAANVPTIPAPQSKDGSAPDAATRIVNALATGTPAAELSAAMSQGGASFGEGRESSSRPKSEVRLKPDTVMG